MGVLILAVLTTIPSNNNHAFAEDSNTTGFGQQPPPTNNTGFGQPQSNNTGNAQQSNSTLPYHNVNTTNAYCDSCNNDIYYGKMNFANMVLAVHNRERAAVGVPPLVWNDTAAAHAKDWAEWNAKHGKLLHCIFYPNWKDIESCTHHEGENLASGWAHAWEIVHHTPPPGHNTTVPIAQNVQGWIAEKNYFQGRPSATGTTVTGHYLQMISRDTKSVGCGTATNITSTRDVLSCRYYPPGINVTGVGSGPIQ
jgi:hypothetical protein